MGTLSGDYSSSILDMLKNMVFRVRCTWRSNCFTVQICMFTVSLSTKQQYNIQMQIADMYNTKHVLHVHVHFQVLRGSIYINCLPKKGKKICSLLLCIYLQRHLSVIPMEMFAWLEDQAVTKGEWRCV